MSVTKPPRSARTSAPATSVSVNLDSDSPKISSAKILMNAKENLSAVQTRFAKTHPEATPANVRRAIEVSTLC